jgi:hypothetical protein
VIADLCTSPMNSFRLKIPVFDWFVGLMGVNALSLILLASAGENLFVVLPLVSFPLTFFAAVGAAFGSIKGRIGAGFWYGFFFGPIGWLMIAIGPNNTDRRTLTEKLFGLKKACDSAALTAEDFECCRLKLLGVEAISSESPQSHETPKPKHSSE